MTSNVKEQTYVNQIKTLSKDFLVLITNEFSEKYTYFLNTINEKVISLLNIEKPKVMVYGIYNSGKSTLINSLCREEVAEMADRPMTDQISEYDRGDYYLIDSPGIDAPIAHEKVTDEFLDKCHVILFVISSKGMFEDLTNYRRLADLISKNVPFIIVLNDRGTAIQKEWSQEEKMAAKKEHEKELKIIQHKIIKNLTNVSDNSEIVDKYEVVIVNAKRALAGITRNKPELIENSNIEFLEKRIMFLLKNDSYVAKLFKRPIFNLKECLNEVENEITKLISGNELEDFSMGIHVLSQTKDNIMQDMRILVKRAVYSHEEELSNSYIRGNGSAFNDMAESIFKEVNELYVSKINELAVCFERNFKDDDIEIDIKGFTQSNLNFGTVSMNNRCLPIKRHTDETNSYVFQLPEFKEKGRFETKRKFERRQEEYLNQKAEIMNQKTEFQIQEQIRIKQEARQIVSSDLDELYRYICSLISSGFNEKYNDMMYEIQKINDINSQAIKDNERKMNAIKDLQNKLYEIENSIA